MRLPIALASSALAVAAVAPRAHADEIVATAPDAPHGSTIDEAPRAHERVVLVAMSDLVFSATAAALGPWSIAVEATDEPAPASDADASALAQAHGATAVAWLAEGELVVYDDLERTSERRAASPPADDASAAAIALSIKTMLRQPVRIAVVEPPPPPPVVDEPVVTVVAPPAPRPGVHATARLAAGLPLSRPAPTMTRAGVRLSVDAPFAPRLAFAAGVEAALPGDVTAEGFDGRYGDLAAGLGFEWRQPLTARLWLVPSIAGTLHRTHLSGTVTDPMPKDVTHIDYAYGGEVEVAVETGGRLRAGAAISGSVLGGRELYKVRGVDVLRVPAATLGLAVRISFQ